MGDRSNVFIQHGTSADGRTGVGLYSHWGGEHFTQRAVEIATSDLARSRIGDESYFTRIVFQTLMNEFFDGDSATGGGVWVDGCPDNEYPVLVIDALTGDHWYASESTWMYPREQP